MPIYRHEQTINPNVPSEDDCCFGRGQQKVPLATRKEEALAGATKEYSYGYDGMEVDCYRKDGKKLTTEY